jgi:two-component system, NtrC family, response regulator PilR
MKRSRILFVSGHPDDARRLSRMVETIPLWLDHAGDLRQARTKLQQNQYDVVLTEAHIPDGTWLDMLELARGCSRAVEVIVTDPQADAQFWAEALNLGAYDLLAQPFYEPEVRRILSCACSRPQYRTAPGAAV